jgi:hypothetical protein
MKDLRDRTDSFKQDCFEDSDILSDFMTRKVKCVATTIGQHRVKAWDFLSL